jgi:aspartyl-tRNA(Asn)/glutamyl-tRNA(Gln) amidotransferase subunit B
MEDIYSKYELVVGLEVHAQLQTVSKAFCADPYSYGSAPNTQVSPISLGHPGTLPKPNIAALKLAVRMGLACNSEIVKKTHFARKNYFYADLPKGYQITQYTTPLCVGGFIEVKDGEGNPKKITLDKIIMEEDSGKSIHDLDPFSSLVDLNRAGVPLIEIVSQPDIRTPDEAGQYLTEIRQMVRYLDICDGNMEEGSLRCDANVSIRPKGSDILNTRVEIKNLNSIRNVTRAIAYEFKRQVEVVEQGGRITPDTRGFDPVKGSTFGMRSKELANDYRYFPEPDIPPIVVSQEYINKILSAMPSLPSKLRQDLISEYNLSEYDAGVITAEKETALYYLELVKKTSNFKAAANWILGPIRFYLNENALELKDLPVSAEMIAHLADAVESGKISFSTASQMVFPELINRKGNIGVDELILEMNLLQTTDDTLIERLVKESLSMYPDKVAEYKAGKKGLIGLFMGEVMKRSQGKADPKVATRILQQELEKS